MTIKSITKTVYIGHNGAEFATEQDAKESILLGGLRKIFERGRDTDRNCRDYSTWDAAMDVVEYWEEISALMDGKKE